MSVDAVATPVKERPILFSGPMVQALLAGRKTQTRRIINPQPSKKDGAWYWSSLRYDNGDGVHYFHTVNITAPLEEAWARACPHGRRGDRLWVREAFRQGDGSMSVHYRADPDEVSGGPWRPSIHMPRWASRLTLEVADVRVQRLQELSGSDAVAEGVIPDHWPDDGFCWDHDHQHLDVTTVFACRWDSINGKRADWMSNPWVWAITFRKLDGR